MSTIPEGWKLVVVNAGFDDLIYWLGRCDEKGHLERCSDLIDPWARFDYLPAPASLTGAQAEIARLRGALEEYAALKDEVIGLRQRLQREHAMRKELEEEDFARRYNQTTYGL